MLTVYLHQLRHDLKTWRILVVFGLTACLFGANGIIYSLKNDRLAKVWSIQRPSADVYSIRFVGTRTAAGSFGLGFDLFAARTAAPPVPTLSPAAWIALALMMGALAWRRIGRQ